MKVTSSGSSKIYVVSNALRDPVNVGNECIWNNSGSVAIWLGKDLFWQVDLGSYYDIVRIRIRGMDITRSNNVQVSVCNDKAAKDCSDCGEPLSTPVNGSVEATCLINGRYVRLFNPDSGVVNWHFCRVSIYSLKRK